MPCVMRYNWSRWHRPMQIAEAVSHGAITIVNAIATGKGAALGIGLWTKARVTVTERAGSFKGRNLTEPNEDVTLIETTVREIFQRFKVDDRFGACVETHSTIPSAVGLKSSSAASNAVALASLKALEKKVDDLEAINFGVEASLKARVTLTGAFDDACACFFGGVVITDNKRRRILKRIRPRGHLRVLVQVPKRKRYTKDIDPQQVMNIRPLIPMVHREVLRGNCWSALTLNGLLYSAALGYDTSSVRDALQAGAIAAGLSGKGPAVAAIVPSSSVKSVLNAWGSCCDEIIETSFNYEKAHALRVPD
jgi:shikimate kinase